LYQNRLNLRSAKIDSREAKIESLPPLLVRRTHPLNLSPCREEEEEEDEGEGSSRGSGRRGRGEREGDGVLLTRSLVYTGLRHCAAEEGAAPGAGLLSLGLRSSQWK
jgi:hypothetical protein